MVWIFSTSGCPYGEGCHFLHYVPGGMVSLGSYPSGNSSMVLRKESLGHTTPLMPQHEQGSTRPGFKSRLCKSFDTPEGCRFGQKCNFAHGEADLMKSNSNFGDRRRPLEFSPNVTFEDNKVLKAYQEPSPPGLAASFGAVSIAKVVIDAALSGIIIGKGGVNAKAISRTSGAKIYIKDHESDVTLKNVEMEGSFDQIQEASRMVRELLSDKDITRLKANGGDFKSKLCENFPKGTCTFGDRCHFAHSQGELHHQSDGF